jgi:hypothetical protein
MNVVLRGGARDGDSASVADEVRQLHAASDAPGMVDVYERTDEHEPAPGEGDRAVVFRFAGREAAGDLPPDLQHMPPEH